MKLRTKLLLFLVPLVAAPLIALGWLAFEELRDSAEETVLKQMDTLLDQVALNTQAQFRTAVSNVKLFSGSGLLKNFVFADENDRYRFVLLPLLNLFASYNKAYPDYEEIRLLATDGFEEARFAPPELPNVTEEEGGTVLFKRLVQDPDDIFAEYVKSPDTGEYVLMVAQDLNFVDPTFEDSTIAKPSLRGYLALTVDLERLEQQVQQNQIGRTGFIFFATERGYVLFPETGETPMQQLPEEHLGKIRSSAKTLTNVTAQINGQEHIMQARQLPGGLYLVAALPSLEISRAGHSLGIMAAQTALIAIALTVGLMFLAVNIMIIAPLKRLGRGAEAIEAGDLDVSIELKGQDEIAVLARQFNAMAQGLKEIQELKDQAQAEALSNKQLAIENLQHADKLKDEFLANTSHELRTPLHGMIGIAESLLGGAAGPLNNNVRANLQLLMASGRRLSNLVNDILDFAKLRHQDLRLALRAVDVASAVSLVLKTLEPLAAGKGLDLHQQTPADLPLARADEDRLQQILYNIVGNAVKFTNTGSVIVQASQEGGMVRISVQDTGPGIPEDKLEAIFESFEQLDGAADRIQGGTGLGLAITRKLIQSHGGDIQVASEPGNGSVFSFTLPLADADTPRAAATTSAADAAALLLMEVPQNEAQSVIEPGAEASSLENSLQTIQGEGRKVLAVDDEPVNLQVVTNHLGLAGFTVIQAVDGIQALELLENDAADADLVLLDVMMPRLNGFEVCERIRQTRPPSELPVIFLTARGRTEDVVQGLLAGGNDYIPKPFARSELLARVQLHATLAGANRELAALNRTLEARVEERTATLDAANKKLEKQNAVLLDNQKLREQLEQVTRHDLKSPVAGMISICDLIRSEGGLSEDQQFLADKLVAQGYELINTINQSLSRHKLELGTYELHLDLCDLLELLRRIDVDTRLLQRDMEAEFRLLLEGEAAKESDGFLIQADQGLCYSMLSNLVCNALEASPAGGTVTVNLSRTPKEAVISIHNMGAIPDEIRDRFAEKYATAGKRRGSGLGAFSARLVAERHGGSMKFTTSEEAGTEITLRLPLHDTD